jgi:alkylation response protein AidB-like acyl-CoA dehydrogenase
VDFEFTAEEIEFRKEVEDFITAEMPPDWEDRAIFWPGGYGTVSDFEEEFKEVNRNINRKLGERGWLSLGWPEEYCGSGSMMKQAIVNDTLSYYRLGCGGISTVIAGPTIVFAGSEEMKKEWLPRIARGEIDFWLGYSEPNAGSDLSAIKTTAVEDGDDLIINGQKIWSSGAHLADYAWLLARTDPGQQKHKGMSLIIVDNNTPGITIRPIINICGIHSFNEVFFDDVRVPKKNVVGGINRGFYNVMLALQFERIAIGSGTFRRVLHELVDYVKETESGGCSLSEDPHIRSKLASMAIEVEVFNGLYWKTVWMIDKGLVPELEASALKLFATELGVKLANAGMDILGSYGQLSKDSKWAPLQGRVFLGYLDSISGPIGAGTSEVQKSIIATRGLGLPRG